MIKKIKQYWIKKLIAHYPLPEIKTAPPPIVQTILQNHFKNKTEYTRQSQQALQTFLESDEILQFPQFKQPKLSIILVFYNRAELSYLCLRSILEQVKLPYELIIVDNHSTDQTPYLIQRIKGAKLILNAENKNFLLACNQAAERVEGEFILFLNNDALLLPEAIEQALAVFEQEQDVGAVGGQILLLNGRLQEAGSMVWRDGSCLGYGRDQDPQAPEFNFRREVDYCSGAFLLTPSLLFKGMGGFDEAFVPAYYEETDYCISLHERGYKVFFEPRARIMHYEFASSKSSEQAIALQQEHQRLFQHKHQNYLEQRLEPKPENILIARSTASGQRVLYIDDRVPHQSLGSGFPRSNFILNTLVEQGYQVTLYPLNFPDEDDWSSAYADIDPKVEIMLRHGRPAFEAFIQERQGFFDVIFVSRPHNQSFVQPIIDKIYGNQKPYLIYDAEALFSIREAKKQELMPSAEQIADLDQAIGQEVALARSCDAVVTVSEREKEQFSRFYSGPIAVIGHALPQRATPEQLDQRRDILFVGNLDYDDSPNVDSVLWFVGSILPIIQEQLTDIQLHLVGSAQSAKIQALKDHSGVQVHGRVPELQSFYEQARLFIAPTRYAGGIPYKIHEAASYGLPVVATQLLGEQLGWQHERELLLAPIDDPARFAQACIRLCTDDQLWHRIRKNALQAIADECHPDQIKQRINHLFHHE